MEENSQTQILEHFKDCTTVTGIIDILVEHSNNDILLEADLEKLTFIFDEYQEQPHLLDPYLESYIDKLLVLIKDAKTTKKAFHQAFRYLYLITKVRGYKYTIRLFTHDVADLEPILKLLSEQSPTDYLTWETRYILLLWLAIVCIIPFDLSRLDGNAKDFNDENSVVNRILKTAMLYLSVSDKSKDAAAYLTAKFITRPDLKGLKVEEFVNWSIKTLHASDVKTMGGMNTITGILSCLGLLFKHGKREELLPYAPHVLSSIVDGIDVMKLENTLIRKLAVKLVQRVGLIFLAPRVTTWRYLRGNRSLSDNLKSSSSAQDSKVQENTPLEEEDFDIPEEVESVIGFLITALEDNDTIVRWSAAKGVGRITGRLPLELADEVVGSLLSCFMYTEQDGAWHGGCLALAELGRRGLLLPKHLSEVVPIVLKALLYDERRGSYSVGSHVRDAACYVCWSFARAYDPEQIKPFVQDIATALLIVTVFDREVNCRRAASAAFQENVGRQGIFPHGIDILTAADYFAVGNRVNCFCNLSVYIGSFPEYTHKIMDHLALTKVSHWDSAIRELTSKSLHNLTMADPEYMQNKILPELFKQTSSFDICAKHGSIIALAEVVHALYLQNKEEKLTLDVTIYTGIKQLVARLINGNEFRGFGGELMRKAVCKFIEKFALSQIEIDDDSVLENWLFVIDTTAPHTEPTVQIYAIEALEPFCTQYVKSSMHFKKDIILKKYFAQLKSNLKFDRMGFAKAIGALPAFMVTEYLNEVIEALIECCKVDENKVNAGLYAESRHNSTEAILRICETVGVTNEIICQRMNDIYECLFASMKDYTKDSRGDVGAWARESAMTTLVDLTCLCAKDNSTIITETLCHRIMCCLLQQASEKIDRVRLQAGKLILKFIHCIPDVPQIPNKKELLDILPVSLVDTMNWAAPNEAFTTISKLLNLQKYQYPILLGLATSAGGLTESLVRHSSECLLNFLAEYQENEEEMDNISEHFLSILQNYPKDERVIIPIFKLLDILFSSGCFDIYSEDEKSGKFPLKLFLLAKEEMKACGDIRKILASLNVFCCLLQFCGDVRTKSLQQLMMYLCHKYPRIRKATAEQLYTTFLTYEEVLPDKYNDNVMSKLTEISWDDTLDVVREHRNELCEWFDLPVPKLKKKTTTTTQQPVLDDLDSYKDLITRIGGY